MTPPNTFVPDFHDEKVVRKMSYKNLGNTDIQVSALALGTGGFSKLYGKFDIEECKKTVLEAIKSGINFIDTAPFYGQGQSEEVVGQCLKGIPRKAFYVATKVGRYGAEPQNGFDFSRKRIMESIDESLEKLGLDYVDVLQVHDIEFAPNLDIILNETLPAVEEIVKSGKARFIGITGYPVSTLVECLERSKIGIDSVLTYARLTMIDDTLETFIPRLRAKKVGIICAAANALGLLSSYGTQPWHPATDEIKKVSAEAREYCKKNDVEIGKLAVYHTLQQDGPDTVLVGMNTPKLLNYNLGVLYNGLDAKEQKVYAEVMKILQKAPMKHWEGIEVADYWKALKELQK